MEGKFQSDPHSRSIESSDLRSIDDTSPLENCSFLYVGAHKLLVWRRSVDDIIIYSYENETNQTNDELLAKIEKLIESEKRPSTPPSQWKVNPALPAGTDIYATADVVEKFSEDVFIVAIAGGRASRMLAYDKLLRPLVGGQSAMSHFASRIKPLLSNTDQTYVITSSDQADGMRDILGNEIDTPNQNIIGEPFRLDTGAAVASATAQVFAKNPDGIVAIRPGDHIISPVESYHKAQLKLTKKAQETDQIVLLGVRPTKPSPAFGYIAHTNGEVTSFGEKPSIETAQEWVDEGRLWNGGEVTAKASILIDLIKKYHPTLSLLIDELIEGFQSSENPEKVVQEVYQKWPIDPEFRKSFDIMVLEKAGGEGKLSVEILGEELEQASDMEWSDVGNFNALVRNLDPVDEEGNRSASAHIQAIHSTNNTVHALPEGVVDFNSDKVQFTLINCHHLTVKYSGDHILIVSKDSDQLVKEMTSLLRNDPVLGYIVGQKSYPEHQVSKLNGSLMKYHWGDPDLIPNIVGIPTTGEPVAELWMGAHSKAPSEWNDQPLNLALRQNSPFFFNNNYRRRLSYLFKLLAVKEPLSIQLHPDKEKAKIGFDNEQKEEVPLNCATRVYLDDNHKPELAVALTSFEAKCGFREIERTKLLFEELSQTIDNSTFDALHNILKQSTNEEAIYKSAMEFLLELEEPTCSEIVQSVVSSCEVIDTEQHQFANAINWTLTFQQYYPGDIGIIVALLLNHISVKEGGGLFLPHGQVHAYLSGEIIELMANSDNVIRCGLTSKHKDTKELLNIADFKSYLPPVETFDSAHFQYQTPIEDFSLWRHQFTPEENEYTTQPSAPEILFVTSGNTTISWGDDHKLQASKGEQILIAGSTQEYNISSEDALIWRATENFPS